MTPELLKLQLQGVLENVQQVIQQPGADPKLSALVFGMAAVVLLIILMLVMLLFVPREKKLLKTVQYWVPEGEEGAYVDPAQAPAPDDAEAEVEEKHPLPLWLRPFAWLFGAGLVPVLIIAAVGVGYYATSTNEYCINACHYQSPAVASYKLQGHAHASCVSCHEAGPVQAAGNATQRARMIYVAATEKTTQGSKAPVASNACLRCHKQIQDGTVTSERANVRMRHKEPLEAGMTCTDCHGPVGHIDPGKPHPVSMGTCMTCHDGKKASSECQYCHTSDVSIAGREAVAISKAKSATRLGSGRHSFPAVEVGYRDCTGCHDMKKNCDTCHGTHMPHSERFIQGYHAKEAAWDKKKLCWRCHSSSDCERCHLPFRQGHMATWKQEHAIAPWDAGCSCHGRGQNEDVPICVFCHDDAKAQKVGPPQLTPNVAPPVSKDTSTHSTIPPQNAGTPYD